MEVALTEGKESAKTMGNPRHSHEELVRYRVYPATVPPMPPYWWNTESTQLRSKAEARRRDFSPGQRAVWDRLSQRQLGAKCLRGVVVSGHVVDFFVPEARLIIDTAPAPKWLGRNLLWMTVTQERLAHDVAVVVADIHARVVERTGVIAYNPYAPEPPHPVLPPFGTPEMAAIIDAARQRAA